jgi:hypothetical protein
MITDKMVEQAATDVAVRRLQAQGYIVIPPSARRVWTIGPLVIETDPVGIGFSWKRGKDE